MSALRRTPRPTPIADAERAAQLLHALRHAAQAEMAGPFPVGRQADAVVGRPWPRSAANRTHGDLHSRGLGVAQGIDQALPAPLGRWRV